MAQALLAFHGDCVTAYNSKNKLWESDRLYNSIFSENLTAEHIIFTYALSRSIDLYKRELQQKADDRIDIEEEQHKYFLKRGSKMLLLFAISKCIEGILNNKIRDNWALEFKNSEDFDKLVNCWMTVISAILPLAVSELGEVLEDGLKNKELSENKAHRVAGIFATVKKISKLELTEFVNAVTIK